MVGRLSQTLRDHSNNKEQVDLQKGKRENYSSDVIISLIASTLTPMILL